MEHVKVTDEWLYKYMPIVDEAIIQELESQVDTDYKFSRKFERKMKRLMRREAHQWIGITQTIIKQVVVFMVGIIGVALIFTMSVEAYRVKFFETIKTIWEDSVLYSYFVDEKRTDFYCIEPGYIPEGYQEIERIVTEHWFSLTYENENGDLIIWDQVLIMDGRSLVMDSEYEKQVLREVNGDDVVINIYSDGYINAYYEHGEYVYLLTANKISIEEVCSLFKIK